MKEVKKLYRSTTNKKIAGICGGLEEYTGVDATVWRIVFIITLLPGGVPGIILYLLLWLVIPERPTSA